MKHQKIFIAAVFVLTIVTSMMIGSIYATSPNNSNLLSCNQDSDCGVSYLTGVENCINNDIYKDRLTPKCTDGYCTNVTIPELKYSCEDDVGLWGNNYCTDDDLYHSRLVKNSICQVFNNGIAGCNFSEMFYQEEKVQDCEYGCDTINNICKQRDLNCNSDNDCLNNEFCDKSSCNAQSGKCVNIPENCPMIYIPVCGCDGKTYPNDCIREQNKIIKNHDGACEEIKCQHDSDCGTDGFVNDGSCQLNQVFKDYITYKCVNPGETNSKCSSSTELRFFLDCGASYCSTNFGSNYCNGKDVYHDSTCYNKGCKYGECFSTMYMQPVLTQNCTYGCLNGACVPGPFICSKNLDCGTDTFVGDKYCKGKSVYQDYISNICNNPGTNNSICSTNTTSKLIEQCDESCKGGKCTVHNPDDNNDGFDDINITKAKVIYADNTPRNYTILELSPTTQKITNETSVTPKPANLFGTWAIIIIVLIVILILLIIVLAMMR